jgi:hypothetical protein
MLQMEAFKESIFPRETLKRNRQPKISKKKPRRSASTALTTFSDRIDDNPMPRLHINASTTINETNYAKIVKSMDSFLSQDQLKRQISRGRAFAGYQEAAIRFLPSFKYDKHSNRFDSSPKRRAPAWTDRILYSRHNPAESIDLEVEEYNCIDSRHSDHRPVYARFKLII